MTATQTAIALAYQLESLLRILALATDGEQIAGRTFEGSGGGAVLELAADIAGKIVEALER
jgi:hypothetical protein